MVSYLYKISDFYLFILLSGLLIIASLFAIWVVKRYVPLSVRYKDNPVLGSVSSLIGIIYGVLAGLMALYLINNISYTSDAVQREANAVANIFRDTTWLKEPIKTSIRSDVKAYLEEVIYREWPSMQKGETLTADGKVIINNMANHLVPYQAITQVDVSVFQDLLQEIKTLYNAREQRIHMSYNQLNPETWLVILIGTILTLSINYLFGMNIYLHALAVGAAALMASAMIFLIVTLDRPFQGEFVIDATAFEAILKFIESKPPDGSVNRATV